MFHASTFEATHLGKVKIHRWSLLWYSVLPPDWVINIQFCRKWAQPSSRNLPDLFHEISFQVTTFGGYQQTPWNCYSFHSQSELLLLLFCRYPLCRRTILLLPVWVMEFLQLRNCCLTSGTWKQPRHTRCHPCGSYDGHVCYSHIPNDHVHAVESRILGFIQKFVQHSDSDFGLKIKPEKLTL